MTPVPPRRPAPRLLLCLLALGAFLLGVGEPRLTAQGGGPAWLAPYRETVTRLTRAATADDFAWQRLAELTDTYGSRLSGSENYARAAAWAVETMRKDGLEAHTEEVLVPRWERGFESAEIVDPPRHAIVVAGLGGTVPTPAGGLEADVLVVETFEELRARAAEARGRIVLFNAPFVNYTETVSYRTSGARAAALYGASAVLVRSVGPMGLRTVHTGTVNYVPDATAIPAAAISAEDANRIARLTARGRRVRIRLVLENQPLPDVPSVNVVGELRGREHPEQVVLLGGHLDSWDAGTGASDDAVGCIVTWEALRLMRRLGLQPRRTVRVVLWANEENGLRGGVAYAAAHAAEAKDHVFALESDSGVFWPATLGFSGSNAARLQVRDIVSLLAPLGFGEPIIGGGGADIGPIAQAGNAPTMAYIGDAAKFFPIHHTPADTVDRIAPEDVSRAAAAIAALSWVIAEMPERFAR